MNKFSDYLETIAHVNVLTTDLNDDLKNVIKVQWIFHSGMLFSSKDKWWGDYGTRKSLHEGVDITMFKIKSKMEHKIFEFNESIKIPAMDDGIILNICDDLLGKTIVIKQKENNSLNRQVLFVYAHILPENNLITGSNVKKNDIIAKICNTHKHPQIQSQIPCHLHLSCFETLNNIKHDDLNWDMFTKSPEINLINPVFL